ncbi:FMN adenylyltransferase /riboflavin kinase [Motilibacter rhizosphaerae]|uniref:Riboflavin biosynthesis protein n=1 Tax=Motilibacter rhizosphaerae TaxID=598652 RepID=A0A4Q7NNY0_9ACTN|nr:bifunctional riboflavin kinase/FAD synthetase [Motilibacter rhizosphaerae]RZS86949.1 FMN adenylyltransferase /riboflavin kinase [Motilibacter rhizosphaerae]
MDLWQGLAAVPPAYGPSAVAVGVFDGVHRGHRAVVARAVADAAASGAAPVVVTFDPHPLEVLRPAAAPRMLTSARHRAELLDALGVAGVLVLPFDREMAAWPPERFVADVLVGALQARTVVVGEDFRFGARAAGDVALLRTLGAAAGFTVDAVAPVGASGHRWSSTFVRDRIALGEVETAADALERPHRVEGTVVTGDQRGRELGFPTANLAFAYRAAVPADGIYAGWLVRPSGERLPAAVSIGTNPTFDGVERRVEAYVLGFDDRPEQLDLYGERVALEFVARIRDTVRYTGVEALVEQMHRDVRRVAGILGVG